MWRGQHRVAFLLCAERSVNNKVHAAGSVLIDTDRTLTNTPSFQLGGHSEAVPLTIDGF